MDMNLGLLSKLGFIERRGDVILEGPLLDLVMDTDVLKERIINGALADVFQRAPLAVARRRPVSAAASEAANDIVNEPDPVDAAGTDVATPDTQT
jgi:hypothetical protein